MNEHETDRADGNDAPQRRSRPRLSLGISRIQRTFSDPRRTDASNPSYVEWLRRQSMLGDAKVMASGLSGQASMWRNAYAVPDSRRALDTAAVWFTTYPSAMITKPGESFLATLASDELWAAFEKIGITAIHTGPTKVAGGIDGWHTSPSVDGQFDRISTRVDAAFGTEEEFQQLTDTADRHGGIIIDDIVPGHTGKGADFRLAEMGYKEYPGIYHMIEVPEEHWHLLPDVPEGDDSANLSPAAEAALTREGLIIGSLQRVIFYQPGVKETNWSATREVLGVDGVTRRWVYLHYFKAGQPTINWLDPTFAGMRLVIGDALHSLGDLGASALRLDANGFLAAERSADGRPAWSEGHPLSHAANQFIGSVIRKVGGFSFQELNLTVEDIRDSAAAGADLSYDFITRPAYQHALLTGDTEFLRLTLRTALEYEVQPVMLVHGMQNHDELTYELVHWTSRHGADTYVFRDHEMAGASIAATIRNELTEHLTGNDIDYNRVFTTNGIACTSATVVAAKLGVRRLSEIDDEVAARIQQGHLLLAMYNAWQPGAFALSAWDLVGALTVPQDSVADLMATGDTRWIERGAVDILGECPDAQVSEAGLPRARALYGSIPAQLEDEASFLSQLSRVIRVRDQYRLPVATQVDVPEVSQPGLLVLVHRLDDGNPEAVEPRMQVTVLNFASEPVLGIVHSEHLPARRLVTDAMSREVIGRVDDLQSFPVQIGAMSGLFLVIGGEETPTSAIPVIVPEG